MKKHVKVLALVAMTLAVLSFMGCPPPVTPEVPKSSNADLSALTLSTGTLSPAFAAETLAYTAAVSEPTTSITVTPTIADTKASVTVNGTAVVSGTESQAITLVAGDNILTVVVKAEDASTKTYTVTVNATGVKNALSSLTVSAGSMAAFAATTFTYNITLDEGVSTFSLTPTISSENPLATIKINDSNVASGTASVAIPLSFGLNPITVVCTAADKTTAQTYTVNVTRVGTNAYAKSIVLRDTSDKALAFGTLFDKGVISYRADVANTVTSVKIASILTESAFIIASSNITVNSVAYDGTNAVSLSEGDNAIVIAIKSPDASVTKTYTFTIHRAVTNETATVSVEVLNSLNGARIIGDYTVSYVENGNWASGSVVTTTASTNPSTITLPINGIYDIKIAQADRSDSMIQSYTVKSQGNNLFVISKKLGILGYPTAAPKIASVDYTTDDLYGSGTIAWQAFEAGMTIADPSKLFIRVVSSGSNPIEACDAGFGVKVCIDDGADTFNGHEAIGGNAAGDSYTDGSGWASESYYDLSGTYLNGNHTLNIVAYDIANNRTEMSSHFVVSNVTEGSSLFDSAFSALTVDMRTYGNTRGYYGKNNGVSLDSLAQVGGVDVSYRVALTFKLLTATINTPILGFKVYSSTDQANWKLTGSVNYGALSAGASGVHTFYETDPSLVLGQSYYFKVVAFTGTALTSQKESGIVSAKLVTPFTVSLTSPARNAQIEGVVGADATTYPNMSFTLSDTSQWSSTVSDYFYFYLLLKDKTGNYVYGTKARYRFSNSTWSLSYYNNGAFGWYPLTTLSGAGIISAADLISYNAGVITVKLSVFADPSGDSAGLNPITGSALTLKNGETYEWDIFGDRNAGGGNFGTANGMWPVWFEKGALANGSISKAYANSGNFGNDALNGWSVFYVK